MKKPDMDAFITWLGIGGVHVILKDFAEDKSDAVAERFYNMPEVVIFITGILFVGYAVACIGSLALNRIEFDD